MKRPSVSIIVPVYHVEPYVEACLRSVMRQTYDGSMECILVDDCGTDESMAIAGKLIAEYTGAVSFKVLHHTHNRGLSAARNTGMDVATGDYLFFLDSDDELTDDCIESLAKPLEKEWHDVVMGCLKRYRILPSGQQEYVESYLEQHLPHDVVFSPSTMMRTISEWQNMTAWNRLLRADFIRQNHLRFKEGLIYEDHLWSFQIACLASSFYVVSHTAYLYRYRDDGLSAPDDGRKYYNNLMIIIKDITAFVDERQIETDDYIYRVYRLFFYKLLDFHTTTLSDFVSTYQEMRPYVKAPVKSIIHANGFHIKKIFHDLHFMMPPFIASYWEYLCHRYFYVIVSGIKKQIIRDDE